MDKDIKFREIQKEPEVISEKLNKKIRTELIHSYHFENKPLIFWNLAYPHDRHSPAETVSDRADREAAFMSHPLTCFTSPLNQVCKELFKLFK